MRRHAHEEGREFYRRARGIRGATIGIPLAPERRIRGLYFLTKPFVQRFETMGLMEIRKRVTGHAECGRRRG
jgi:hypothetical protein